MNKKHSIFRIVIVFVILIAIPLTLYLIKTTVDLLRRHAEANTISITMVPPSSQVTIGASTDIELYVNAGEVKVSGVTVSLIPLQKVVELENIQFITDTNAPYDEVIYNKDQDPYTFTLLAKRPTQDLPSGVFKIATARYTLVSPGDHTITIDENKSSAVGVLAQSPQTQFSLTSTGFTASVTGTLCRIDACTLSDQITLTEQPRNDNNFNIILKWSPPTKNTPVFYKIYRSLNTPLSTPHQDKALAAITTNTTLLDVNENAGFNGNKTVYYDIDTYISCDQPTTPTPTFTSTVTPTVPTTNTPTPSTTQTPLQTATPTGALDQ